MKIKVNFTDGNWFEGDIDARSDEVWDMFLGGGGMFLKLIDGRSIIVDRDKTQNIVMWEDR